MKKLFTIYLTKNFRKKKRSTAREWDFF